MHNQIWTKLTAIQNSSLWISRYWSLWHSYKSWVHCHVMNISKRWWTSAFSHLSIWDLQVGIANEFKRWWTFFIEFSRSRHDLTSQVQITCSSMQRRKHSEPSCITINRKMNWKFVPPVTSPRCVDYSTAQASTKMQLLRTTVYFGPAACPT